MRCADRLEEGVLEVVVNRDAWNTASPEHWTAEPFDSSSVDLSEWQGATPWMVSMTVGLGC